MSDTQAEAEAALAAAEAAERARQGPVPMSAGFWSEQHNTDLTDPGFTGRYTIDQPEYGGVADG
jgi:hypothetical protein